MIEDSIREMTAEERSGLERALRPRERPAGTRQYPRASLRQPALELALCMAAGLVVTAVKGPGPAVLFGVGTLICLYRLGAAYRRYVPVRERNTEFFARYDAERARAIARALEDGRVTVRRVRAVAVIEIEPVEDEGTGYLFDLGDGRVLFFKQYFYPGEDAPWPSTEFEIVRRAVDGEFVDVYRHGTALPPVRVIRHDELDPEAAWDEREEVLEMGLDEAVGTVVVNP
jgi:hypothetical protein